MQASAINGLWKSRDGFYIGEDANGGPKEEGRDVHGESSSSGRDSDMAVVEDFILFATANTSSKEFDDGYEPFELSR